MTHPPTTTEIIAALKLGRPFAEYWNPYEGQWNPSAKSHYMWQQLLARHGNQPQHGYRIAKGTDQ